VENMFPMRADKLFGRRSGDIRRLERRGGPGLALTAFSPGYAPTEIGFQHYAPDLSQTATAGTVPLGPAQPKGHSLDHPHRAAGRGSAHDEHLVPGEGTQPCAEVCAALVGNGFTGHVVAEINTQEARTTAARAAMLTRTLDFAREQLC